ncbi:hypothetical protein GCM10009678_42880 [Actinomadura kijaniata]
MSFDRSRRVAGAAGRPLPSHQRGALLEVLRQVITETRPGLRAEPVVRAIAYALRADPGRRR